MQSTIDIQVGKAQLAALIARAEASQEIVIARADKPVVHLVPIAPPKVQRRTSARPPRICPEDLIENIR